LHLVDGVLYGKVRDSFGGLVEDSLTGRFIRKIAIYHGRPTSIPRADIDADLPDNVASRASAIPNFEASGLLDSIHLTCQAEAFLHQM
jgi:hypothetical protein